MEIILTFTIATFMGIIAGMIPGISAFTVLIMLYPLLIVIDPINVIMIYVVVVSISQYFGSVSSTLFCIPGSATAIPTIHEAHTLFRNGNGSKAIMYAAFGSFIGSIFSLLFSIITVDFAFMFFPFFSTYVKTFLLVVSLFIFMFVGKNKIWINIILVLGGYGLAKIGYNSWEDDHFLTFGIANLYSGIPSIAVILGIYVMPYIIKKSFEQQQSIEFVKLSINGYLQTAKELILYRYVLIRGLTLGYFSSFIPGLTFYIGTTMAYYLEKFIGKRNKTYKEGDISCLLSAETANNAGVFSQLLPLLLLGLPITASQVFIYDIFSMQGLLLTADFFQAMFTQLGIAYIISAIIGLFFAGKYVNWVRHITNMNYRYVYFFILIVLFGITIFVGYTFYQPMFYVQCLFVMLMFGLCINKFDTLPLVFSFLMHDQIQSNLLTLFHLI